LGSYSKLKIKESNYFKRTDYKWVVIITFWTFLTSVLLTFVSDSVMPNANVATAFVILMIFISTGIFFDIIGLAIATASEPPFHSMASRRVSGAKHAIMLIRNAEKASNFCNDVVGDISGIISGSTTAAIVARVTYVYGINSIFLSLLVTGTVAALTVGGKAIGKGYAIKNANRVTFQVGLIMYYFDKIRRKEEHNGNH